MKVNLKSRKARAAHGPTSVAAREEDEHEGET